MVSIVGSLKGRVNKIASGKYGRSSTCWIALWRIADFGKRFWFIDIQWRGFTCIVRNPWVTELFFLSLSYTISVQMWLICMKLVLYVMASWHGYILWITSHLWSKSTGVVPLTKGHFSIVCLNKLLSKQWTGLWRNKRLGTYEVFLMTTMNLVL